MALDFPASPSNGQQFTSGGTVWQWDGAKWFSATSGILYSSTNNVGRDYIHNSVFVVAQRTLPVTATGYTLDRWRAEIVTDAVSFSQATLADADRAAIGDEEAIYALQNVVTTGSAAAGAYNMVHQRIETPRRLAGKTVTVSFWAKAASGTPKIGISIDQVWNSVATNGAGTAVTIATAWARYTASFVVPSGSGKTMVANDYTQLNFWFSSGSTNATRAGSIGAQSSSTFQLWGVQLEIGSVATPLEKLDPVTQLQQCQRFYCTGLAAASSSAGGAGQGAYSGVTFPVTMRAAPTTVTFSAPTYSNSNTTTASAIVASSFIFLTNAVAAGIFSTQANYQASADL